jgi:hypothetical protein
VGLIGVGLLGSALAERLLGGGFRVLGADVDPGRRAALGRLGGDVAADASEVVGSCDCIVLSLPTSEVVRAVLDGAGAAPRPGSTIIDTTTGSPGDAEALDLRLPSLVKGLEIWLSIAPMLGLAFWLGLFWRGMTVAGAWATAMVGFATWFGRPHGPRSPASPRAGSWSAP